MKKILLVITVFAISFSSISCKEKASKDKKTEKQEQTFTVDANKSEVNWTAFKTTDKVPVKGKFTKLTIKNSAPGKTFADALNGTEFSIPVSSLFTNNPDRDHKLKTIYFGIMKNAEIHSGTIHIDTPQSGYVDFSMNGIIEKLPFSYSANETSLQIKTIMDTNTWQAQTAIASINKACYELHKGADGVSKTWSDVAIDISVFFY